MTIKQHSTLIFICAAIVLAGLFAGRWLAGAIDRWGQEPVVQEQVESRGFNERAPIAPNGEPFPINSPEDVVVELFYLDGDSDADFAALKYFEDYDSDSWQVDLTDNIGTLTIRFVEGVYYADEDFANDWFVIAKEDADSVFDAEQVLLRDADFLAFADVAESRIDEPCGTFNCAVWEASDIEFGELLTIRVNKFDRRIDSVSGLNDLGLFNMSYSYETVDLQAPAI